MFDNAVALTEALRELNIPVLWGGIHPTIRPNECLDHADLLCVGEAEESLVELAAAISQGRFPADIAGVWRKEGGRIVPGPLRLPVQDLDSVPMPDYDLATSFILTEQAIRPMDLQLMERYTQGTLITIPSRGCPFGCAYCCNNTLMAMYPGCKTVRKRSIANIMAELVEAKKNLPFIRVIQLEDDAFFMYSAEDIKLFSSQYKEKIGLPLKVSGASPMTLTREKLAPLVDAGLAFTRMGIQSASPRIGKLYGRRQTNDQVLAAAGIINEFRDRMEAPQYDIIVDNPWETDEDQIETLMFLTRLPVPFRLMIYSMTFYPETELYRKAVREGLIKDELREVYRKHYHNCRKTYLNNLFFLLSEYSSRGRRLSSGTMAMLTNSGLRRTGLHYLLYFWLIPAPVKLRRFSYLLQEGFRALSRGDWGKIRRYFRGTFGVLNAPR
jgi:radical SAM superfamily enzyme YgiQ (UPF0313 family)